MPFPRVAQPKRACFGGPRCPSCLACSHVSPARGVADAMGPRCPPGGCTYLRTLTAFFPPGRGSVWLADASVASLAHAVDARASPHECERLQCTCVPSVEGFGAIFRCAVPASPLPRTQTLSVLLHAVATRACNGAGRPRCRGAPRQPWAPVAPRHGQQHPQHRCCERDRDACLRQRRPRQSGEASSTRGCMGPVSNQR